METVYPDRLGYPLIQETVCIAPAIYIQTYFGSKEGSRKTTATPISAFLGFFRAL
jgi:hypothetical protein